MDIRAAVVLGEMMTFRCRSSLLLFATLLHAATANARPAPEAATAVKSAKETAHEAAVVARQAKAQYEAKQFVLAAELYRSAYALNPLRPEFLYGVGRSEQMAGHTQAAREALERLRQLLPPNHPLQTKAATSLVEMQDVVAEPVVVIPPVAVPAPVTPTVAVVELPAAPTPVLVQQAPPPTVVTVAPPPVDSAHTLTRAAMWTGGALILAGITMAIWAEVDRGMLADALGTIRGPDATTRQDHINTLSTGSVVAVAAGAGALALGLYWRIGEAAHAPVVTATPGNVQLSWRF